MNAGCDFGFINTNCDAHRSAMQQCPYLDALAYRSLSSTPGLTYVREGGPAKGVGRCQGACTKGPAPAVPAICNTLQPIPVGLETDSTGCAVPEDYEEEEGWCVTKTDGGRILKAVCPECAVVNDLGQSWGVCAEKPRLPGVGYDYEEAEMAGIMELSLPEILLQYPGCGRIPLQILGNSALRNGGGLYKSHCNYMADRAEECVIEGMHGLLFARFEHNRALSAGGAAYVACHTIGDCSAMGLSAELSSETIGLLANNSARTYGGDLATGPASINLLVTNASRFKLIPGHGVLDLSFSILDGLGQQMQSDLLHELPFLVSATVCSPYDTACSKTTSLQVPPRLWVPSVGCWLCWFQGRVPSVGC